MLGLLLCQESRERNNIGIDRFCAHCSRAIAIAICLTVGSHGEDYNVSGRDWVFKTLVKYGQRLYTD